MQSIIGPCHGAGAFALCVYRFGVSDLVGTRLMSSQIRSYVSDEFMLVFFIAFVGVIHCVCVFFKIQQIAGLIQI